MYRGQKLAIDIGNSSIKLLFGSSRRVLNAASIKTPEESIEDNKIVDIEKIYIAINNYILASKIRVKSVSFSIRGQDEVIRHIEVPIMEKKKLREAVEWEINQYLPESGTNYYIDYEIIDKEITNEKKVYKLLVVAAPKDKVDQYVNLAEMLNLKIDAIDVAANCIARVFSNAARNGKEFRSIGLIDIGSRSSSIVVLDNGKIFMEKEVPFGLENLTRDVSRRLKISSDDANKYIMDNFSFDNINEESEMDRRIQELFNNVFSTFLKVIEFYTTGKVQKSLDELFVIGTGSKLKGLRSYLGKYLSSPVYQVESIEKIGRKIYFPNSGELSFHVNTLGLLIRKNNTIAELNLLPPNLKEKREKKVYTKNYILIGAIGLFIILLLFYIPISGLLKAKAIESNYKAQAEQANGDAISTENENIKEKIEYYKQYIEKVENLAQSKVMVSNKIHELEKYIPEGIVFDSLAYGENSLTINATANSLDSISKFTVNIQLIGAYKNVRVSNIRMEKVTDATSDIQGNEVYKFTINAIE